MTDEWHHSEIVLLLSYDNGARVWHAANLQPIVTRLRDLGLIEPVELPGGAFVLTEAGRDALQRLKTGR
jgi:hypothetical protein